MSEFRRRLRALPDFPDVLPDFDVASAPADPAVLFRQWLEHAISAGVPQPHACSLATADAAGNLSSRMLILKDLDDDGWHFATGRNSRKGRELAENPRAAMNFYWAQLGRQVRVSGTVVELSAQASAADWAARPSADGSANPDWQLYALRPTGVEFFQAQHDRRHIRYSCPFSPVDALPINPGTDDTDTDGSLGGWPAVR
ncbi:pyridoxamine 5'-phosphate oxidase family protein [Paenarthrobacter sp. Z7-10]|uniref:pyridoxine/pyridoxamine 5'-phosphate oxidase n=1 Tax=Paenarthrobacter sp. Z7-10 TaxID=2787635 RepID=UPI0022A920B0|nr:pyridoxamine 5'-phosphate oxidase family protein [Paenarthrobacter sp. Z7-10]MCZ2404324.1 pyridoxamine 5'-phosphate oxidase family protein [Paenarthrobacter sp. Z7-10]